jgi:hypothetical protein
MVDVNVLFWLLFFDVLKRRWMAMNEEGGELV